VSFPYHQLADLAAHRKNIPSAACQGLSKTTDFDVPDCQSE